MKLKKLIKDLPNLIVKGPKEIEITGISAHSRTVSPGNLFIARKGLTQDGSRFIPEAIENGAVALLSDLYEPFLPPHIVQLIHPDIASIEVRLLKTYYDSASDPLLLVGITGTNGKTTCSYLIRHLLEGLGYSCGLIGTIEWIVGKNHFPSNYATPDLFTNYKLLHEMVLSGCKAAVMELSSHGLDQERVKGIEYDVALFTNLTIDHLDYHQTMEHYLSAKAKLFSSLTKDKVAIVNVDTDCLPHLLKSCQAKIITYGIKAAADLQAVAIKLSLDGMTCLLKYKNETFSFTSNLIGIFNVYNCLGAIAVGLSQGFFLPQILEILRRFKSVPGRLERIINSKGLHIFVDYAHTGDALKNVLETLREMKKGKLITVFGCGGNRDPNRRFQMGEAADLFSDLTILTTDNSRNEDPEKIIQDILRGFKNSTPLIELDRKLAIQKAIRLATCDDIVLIAGKGHETVQISSHQICHFDDRRITKEICATLER